MSALSTAEFLLWAVLANLFWAKKLHLRFPAMRAYLALRFISMPILLGELYLQSRPWGRGYFPIYFFSYYAVFIASAVLLFFVCLEVFRSALSAFSGLMRFGVVIFRWAAVVSVILSLATVSFSHRGILIIPDIALGLMRSVSIIELCLLAFLCLSMNALRLSVRDVAFGIALGFGVMSANDFIFASLSASKSALVNPLQYVYEVVMLLSLGIWVVYCVQPEPARKPVVVSANSTIYRWNEIASALGHTGTKIAVAQPSNSFFLTDVEKVVDKVLTRNLKESESRL